MSNSNKFTFREYEYNEKTLKKIDNMKSSLHILFFFISCTMYAQKDTIKESVRLSGRSMSDLPNIISSNDERIAHFEFSKMPEDMSIEISLWKASPDADTLYQEILIFDKLLKREKTRLDVLANQKESQVDIINILSGKYLSISHVKAQKHSIQSFIFKSESRIRDKSVPLLFFVDKNENIPESNIIEILKYQDIKQFNKQTIKSLKEKVGEFKILTYQLKVLP